MNSEKVIHSRDIDSIQFADSVARAVICCAACYDAPVPGKKLVYL